MNLQGINEKEIDRVSYVEKILLATHGINWFGTRLLRIHEQFLRIKDKIGEDDIITDIIISQQGVFNSTIEKLTEILEEIGEYVNEQDATDEIDDIVTTPCYDILHERYKKPTQQTPKQ